LLKDSTVTEAAFASGYKSLAQFITVFRRLTLQSPSEVARVGSSQKSFLPKERAIRP